MAIFSKRGGTLEGHPLARDGMDEFQTVGMQVEAVGGLAVELVAADGASQAVGMGTVHAQLVGASGLRIEGYAVVANYLIVGCGGLAALIVNHLSRAVDGVAEQGQLYAAFFRCGGSVEQGDVALADSVVGKLLLQGGVNASVLGCHQQSAGAHVEAMGEDGVGVALVEDGGHGMVADAARHAEQS